MNINQAIYRKALAQMRRWRSLKYIEKLGCSETIIDYCMDEPSDNDIADLARVLAFSGELWTWPEDIYPRSDVVSTGGVGSLTTLLCPILLAAVGCFVPKVSVPGSVAGAIDTLGCIPSFRTELTRSEMLQFMRKNHIASSTNTLEIAPADGFLFSLRSKTGRKSIPALVIASLLAKKIAVSCFACAVDVRCGETGNLGETPAQGRINAERYVKVAEMIGINVTCILTNAVYPPSPVLGRRESLTAVVRALTRTDLDPWLQEHVAACIRIACEAAMVAGMYDTVESAYIQMCKAVSSGYAYRTLLDHITCQGSDEDKLEVYLHQSRLMTWVISSISEGILYRINQSNLLRILRQLNSKRSDQFGLRLLVRPGDSVNMGTALSILSGKETASTKITDHCLQRIQDAFLVRAYSPENDPRQVIDVIRKGE